MVRGEFRKCPTCGEEVPEGSRLCPKGHNCAWSFVDISSQEFTSTYGSGDRTAEVAGTAALSDPMFECYRCKRLVETHEHNGKVIEPRFCPWCGKPLSSILGRELDGYRIDSVISRGGFGMVFLASNITQPSMKAVVKVLHPRLAYSTPTLVKFFIEEARFTEAVGQTCWNVVRVSNVREKPWPYFFMEYVRGTTLDDLVREAKSSRIPIPECVGYLRGIAKALAATHARGRIHRDLKPQNIMVIRSKGVSNAEERVKMLDFGLAVKIASEGEGLGFAEGEGELSAPDATSGASDLQIAGTPEYMPPEAFDGLSDFSGDIYSFGVTSYQILTGKLPWKDPAQGTDRVAYWKDCHRRTPPIPIRELRSDVPKWLATLVGDCIRDDPERRIQNADDLLKRLRAPFPRWVRLAAAAAVLLFGLIAWYGILRPDPGHMGVKWFRDRDGRSVQATRICVQNPEQLQRVLSSEISVELERDFADFSWEEIPGVARVSDTSKPKHLKLQISDLALAERLLRSGELALSGRQPGFFRSLVVAGKIPIVHDTEHPQIGSDYKYVVSGPSGEASPPKDVPQDPTRRRFGAGVSLLVEVVDDHPDAAVLEAKKKDQASPILVPGTPKSDDWWSFDLGKLDQAEYEGHFTARDEAGNPEKEMGRLDFIVDKCVGFDRGKTFLADGNALFEFRLDEKLEEISIAWTSGGKDDGSKPPDPPEFLLADGIDDAFALVRHLDTKPERLDLAALEKGKSYFLVVPVDSQKVDSNVFTVSLKVTDNALPPNEEPCKGTEALTLECPLPGKLRLEDLGTPVIQLDGVEEKPVTGAFLSDGRSDPGAVPIPCSSGGRRSVAASVRFTPKRDKSGERWILRAECSVGGKKYKPEEMALDRLEFRLPRLEANTENRLDFTFRDGLKRSFGARLVVVPDTEVPTLEIATSAIKPAGPSNPKAGYHEVDGGSEIRLDVTASEDLNSVFAFVKGEKDSGRPLDPIDPRRWELKTLEHFELKEGNHELVVEATDKAGRSSGEVLWPLILNKNGPTVTPRDDAPKSGKSYVLGARDWLPMGADDPNGIDLSGVQFTLCRKGQVGQRAPHDVDKSFPEGKQFPTSVDFRVHLEQLPDYCEDMQMEWEVRDQHGEASKGAISFRFERRISWEEEVKWPPPGSIKTKSGSWPPREMTWIRFEEDKEQAIYISRTEISNEFFCHPDFISNAGYRDPTLRKKGYLSPRTFTEKHGIPGYAQADGNPRGNRFPVAGISPDEAEAFARLIGARLPTWDEWLGAARLGSDEIGRYPWPGKYKEEGRLWCNHFKSWELDSKLASRYGELILRGGGSAHHYLPVDVDPFEEGPFKELPAEIKSLRILHQIGNVGEIVVRGGNAAGKSYGIAGGHLGRPYEEIGLLEPIPISRDGGQWRREITTGFRLVIEVRRSRCDSTGEEPATVKKIEGFIKKAKIKG